MSTRERYPSDLTDVQWENIELSKDYEHNTKSSEAWIYLCMIHCMARSMLPRRDPDLDLLPRPPRRQRT